jgi:hypothetical protein
LDLGIPEVLDFEKFHQVLEVLLDLVEHLKCIEFVVHMYL